MITIFRAAFFAVAALALAGCGAAPTCEKVQTYQQSKAGAPLTVPPGLSSPSADGRLEVPASGEGKAAPGECLDRPPRFVELEDDDNLSRKERNERDRKKAIRESVVGWAQAWASRDVEAHLTYYGKKFRPEGDQSLSAFKAARQQTLADSPEDIEIRLAEMIIESTKKNATVRFEQHIKTGARADAFYREMELALERGRWVILKETGRPMT